MFQLTTEEFANLMSQIVISRWGGTRKLPYAFSELGATMLSTVLRSDVAIEASVLVVRAFVASRQLVLMPPNERIAVIEHRLNEIKALFNNALTDQNDINEDTRMKLELINQALAELQVKNKGADKPHRKVGFIKECVINQF